MKSLFIIQKTFNLLKIICIIGAIICFIGTGSALLGYLGINALNASEFKDYISTISDINDIFATFTIAQIQSLLLISLISTFTTGILLLFGYRYLKAELVEGTPFTLTGANNIRTVGIITLILPLISDFIVTYIAEKAEIIDYLSNSDSTFIIGVFLIIISFIFLYGSEIINQPKDKDNSNN